MSLLISKVDKHLVISPKMRGIFPNEKEMVIDLPAEEPVEVPDYIAEYYIKSRPRVFRLAGSPKPEESSKEDDLDNQKTEFNPVEFLEQNYSRLEDALKSLERKELLAIGKILKLTGVHLQKDDRIRERIIQDIKVKNAQQEELEKHKDAENV